MIVDYDRHINQWVAAGKGILRPIFETAPTRHGAIDNFATEFRQQRLEEELLAEQHSSLCAAADGETGINSYEEKHG